MNVTAADIGALLGNNRTFSSPTVYCQTFYPKMAETTCTMEKADEFMNSKMFVDALASGNDTMMFANQTMPPEMMEMVRKLTGNSSMGMN
jgi:hypothetical protein